MIPAAGRTVRCGACTFQWFVQPEVMSENALAAQAVDFAALAEAAAQSGEVDVAPLDKVRARQLPVVPRTPIPTRPFIIAMFVLGALWFVTALFAYFPAWLEHPGFRGFYRMLGAHVTQGLVFSDLRMEREQDGAKTRFVISGAIANHAAAARTLPSVRVQLKDEESQVIWAREYPVELKLDAGSTYPFRITNVETAFAGRVKSIVLDLGHPLELTVR